MLVVISPAKTLSTEFKSDENSELPILLNKSKRLASTLRKLKPAKLSQLMGISAKLGQLNYERYQQWKVPYIYKESLISIYAFRGEVYNGLDIDSFTNEELSYTQDHLRILSGLYGVLRPMDAILAYRLEMGTKLMVGKHKNLYAYWGDTITKSIKNDIKNQDDCILINLASNEYFKSVNTKLIKTKIITPVFKENKGGDYKVVSFFAKKARGLMTRYIMKNQIKSVEELILFNSEGYLYNKELSSELKLVFTR